MAQHDCFETIVDRLDTNELQGGVVGIIALAIFTLVNMQKPYHLLQLGQPSVNPPRLVLEVGGTSTLQAAVPVKLKSPPLQGSKWGGLQLSRHGCLLS